MKGKKLYSPKDKYFYLIEEMDVYIRNGKVFVSFDCENSDGDREGFSSADLEERLGRGWVLVDDVAQFEKGRKTFLALRPLPDRCAKDLYLGFEYEAEKVRRTSNDDHVLATAKKLGVVQ